MLRNIILFSIICFNASAENINLELKIQDHKFIPDILEVPEGKKAKIKIINEDNTVEEFESDELKREKIIPAKSYTIVSVGPLTKGKYKFFGEFHQATAQGYILVK